MRLAYDIVRRLQQGHFVEFYTTSAELHTYLGRRLQTLHSVAVLLRDNLRGGLHGRNSNKTRILYTRLTALIKFLEWFITQEHIDTGEAGERLASALLADNFEEIEP